MENYVQVFHQKLFHETIFKNIKKFHFITEKVKHLQEEKIFLQSKREELNFFLTSINAKASKRAAIHPDQDSINRPSQNGNL